MIPVPPPIVPEGETEAVDLSALLAPDSIAVIGASSDPGRVGGMPLRFLDAAGFPGRVYPVNPRRAEVQGHRAYPEIGAVPEPVDLAILAVPAAAVPDTLAACAAAGTRGAIVFSAGFAEVGGEGERRQREIAKIAAESGMRVCGPNCAGVMNPRRRLAASFGSHLAADPHMPVGEIAIVSQSGAVGAYMFSLARVRGVGLSSWVTTGNEADTQLADYVAAAAMDPGTRVVAAYLEQVRDPQRFTAACEIARRHDTAVVLLLAGRTEASEEALRSHTAALAGDRGVAAAALAELGVIEAESIDDLLALSTGIAAGARPRGPGVGIVTISGAAGIMMVDRCVEVGLEVPRLPAATQGRLRELLPYAATANPLDVTGNVSNTPDVFGAFLDELLGAEEVDGILCFLGHVVLSPLVGARLVDEFAERCAQAGKFACLIGMDDPGHAVSERLAAARIPLFDDPACAVDVFAAALRARRVLADVGPTAFDRRRAEPHAQTLELPEGVRGALSEVEAQRVLARAGVRFPAQAVARDAAEAGELAPEIGEELVLKVVSRDLPHKSDVGGVALGVSPAEVPARFEAIVAAVERAAPDAAIEGVLLQEQLRGHPAIVGAKVDRLFGPTVLVGSGGIDAELIGDTALALGPLDEAAARRLLARTKLGPVLVGSRGREPLAGDELVRLLIEVSRLAWELREEVTSIELNPVLVGRAEAVAVDALVELKGAVDGN